MPVARWKRPLALTIKVAVTLLVLWALGRQVLRTWDDLRSHEVAFHLRPARLVLSGLLYLVGLGCCGAFYQQVLRASPSPIGIAPALRAYLISHLGKYVPGKAMVVVIRAGLSVPYGARAATSAIATFYETLVMMASGSLVAAAGFALAGPSPVLALRLPAVGTIAVEQYQLAAAASLGLALAFLLVVMPWAFRRLSLLFSLPFPKVGVEALPRFDGGLMLRGLGWTTATWICFGASQIEVVRALVPVEASRWPGLMPVVTAAVAFATVAGFLVAVMPGGLGVREGILMLALAPAVGGEDVAVVAALVLRLVWAAVEVLSAMILLPLGAHARRVPQLPAEAGSSVP
ncbi:lysylphosphatidylglycerol synthase domain-containing protein [Aquisphaera insulae]|uniref:lysylphosphatidylglycerol synthase domain-containing protein n=1 Tax=Aquisphaera insulae TaxID=2712864 RepID=UPI0013EBA14B|nr:lysylphosphatidylglycerol synthase domain-containing protein [Aquisphaera insulae]